MTLFPTRLLYVMFCAVWYHLHNLKNVKTPHGGVLPLLFSRFLNCTNGTKLRITYVSIGDKGNLTALTILS